MNPATAKAVRDSKDHGDAKRAHYLLALHSVNGATDDETLDDIAALVEAAFAPKVRAFLKPVPDDLATLRREINLKRQEIERDGK